MLSYTQIKNLFYHLHKFNVNNVNNLVNEINFTITIRYYIL